MLRNQHKFMHFLQRQIRLCGTGSAHPLEKIVDYDEHIKMIEIPESAYQTQSQNVEHDRDTGYLFKVSSISGNKSHKTSKFSMRFKCQCIG